MKVRLRHFDEVAEDLVVADAQALYPRTRSLALLHLREEGLAVAKQRAQRVQLFGVAFAYNARRLAARRQLVVDRRGYQFTHAPAVRERVEHPRELAPRAIKQRGYARDCFEALA